MIKTAKKRSSRSRSAPSLPFIPQAAQIFLAKRIVDIIALGLLFCAGFLLFSLLSYTPADPSLNSAGADADNIHNYGGLYGAWVADFFLQTLGVSIVLACPVLAIWGVRLYKRRPLSPFPARLFGILLACIAGSAALALIPSYGYLVHPYMGSSVGTLILSKSVSFLQGLHPAIEGSAVLVSILTFTLVMAAGFLFAGFITFQDVKRAILAAITFLCHLAMFLYALAKAAMHWLRYHNEQDDVFTPPAMAIQWPSFRLRSADSTQGTLSDPQQPQISQAPRPKPSPSAVQQDTPAPAEPPKDRHIPVVSSESQPARSAGSSNTSNQQRFALSDNGEWELPPHDLLQDVPDEMRSLRLDEEGLRKNAELLHNVLIDFGIQGDIVSIHPGPVVTLYELEPAPGTKSNKIISLADDIARSMAAVSVRCAVVPGRNVIGIELPNKERQFVFMREILGMREIEKSKAHLPLILGKDIGGKPIVADLAKMPHLLVAGTTGSGKSVAVNTMILSLLFRLPPEKCRFIMIDPKMLELSVYDDIPHLLSPVVTEPGKAVVALKWTVAEMEERYRAMSKLGVRNIEGYNDRLREARKKGETIMRKVQTGFNPETGEAEYEDQPMDLTELPYIVVVVDEFADLMLVAGKDVENAIQRLAQMARAAGIHLIMATQRPSVDVITGVIKANFPTRISFQVTSKIDSRTILGDAGAEQLLGMGDMLYMAPGGRITRVHGPFVSDEEVEDVVKFLKQQSPPSYLTDITDESNVDASEVMDAIFDARSGGGSGGSDVDELYDQAVAIVAKEGKVSTSFVQRHLQIGYNRAARIVEEMEKQGIISKASPTGKREILVQDWSDS